MGENIRAGMHNDQASVVLTLTGPPPKFHMPRDVGQHANGADLMHYLAGISQDENTLNYIVTVGSFLSGVAIIVFIGVQVLPAWVLLVTSLQYEGVHQGSGGRYWGALLVVV